MATIKSDQERADELADKLKFDVDVKNNRNEMDFTNISSAKRLEPIQGNLSKAATALNGATDKLASGVKAVAVSIAEADKKASDSFN
jgi:hypothetical protein